MMRPLLLALATLAVGTPVLAAAPTLADLTGSTRLADRARGTPVVDSSGTPLGVVQSSTDKMVVIVVGATKVQVPANAVHNSAGRLSLGATANQIQSYLALAAAYEQSHKSAPKPVVVVKGHPAATVGSGS